MPVPEHSIVLQTAQPTLGAHIACSRLTTSVPTVRHSRSKYNYEHFFCLCKSHEQLHKRKPSLYISLPEGPLSCKPPCQRATLESEHCPLRSDWAYALDQVALPLLFWA